ncbi:MULTISPECIES: hypothetical protein [Enterococcus]|uniref:Uncharacterized protein n=2 Tax=Enterococcus alcedinis TaxID=1274384 RepID=A0A917JE56_9ENTE|nr:hypothetical protein [Enterococcus alcedinis]MBP2102012.1 uncharacterized protein YchJ [Enterococcus alcedinis]GGI65575.1 hypothetical protein GCM10011482_12290 [Enterococcus alcedinis]
MYKKMFIGVAGILFLIFVLNYFNQANKISDNINQEAGEVEVTGKINNQEEALAALAVLEKNLQAANDEDLDLYVSTLVPSAREATKKEMAAFFEEYDVEHTLLEFKVTKDDGERIQVLARQKTINKGSNKYRNHITEANHTFVKIDGEWFLEETSMSDTQFI